MSPLGRLVLLLLALFALAMPAAAHPHVFVTANGELLFDGEGRIKAIGNVWQFDDAFSAFAVEGLDVNQNGKYDDVELQPLAKVNVESLVDFGFFTHLTVDGKEQGFVLPTEYWLEYDGARLTLFFTLPLDLPAAPGKETTFEIFDPEYFVAFEFPGEHPYALNGAPQGCTATYHPPEGLDDQTMAILNALPMDQRQLPPDLQAAADKLADAFSIDCPVVEVAAAPPPAPDPARPTAKSPFGIATPDGGGGMTVSGPFGPVFAWIAARQAEFYKALTDTLGNIKQNGSAAWLLLGIAFLYGVFHAAGPGHGKAVITSYVLASGDTVKRGIALSFAAAFVQALSAIVIVGIATLIVGATAQQITGVTDWLEIASYAAIVLLGLWLVWSKTFGGGHHHHHHHHHFPVPAGAAGGHDDHGHAHHGHGHHHHHDHDHGHAGHRHEHGHHHGHAHAHDHHHHGHAEVLEAPRTAPQDLDELAARRAAPANAPIAPATAASAAPLPGNWLTRAGSAILAVGIRPCSGAIIILVFALSQGLLLAGIAATFVMALGTGLTVAILATLAVSAKGLAMRFADLESGRGAVVVRIVEIGGAFAVLIFGVLLLGGALYPML